MVDILVEIMLCGRYLVYFCCGRYLLQPHWPLCLCMLEILLMPFFSGAQKYRLSNGREISGKRGCVVRREPWRPLEDSNQIKRLSDNARGQPSNTSQSVVEKENVSRNMRHRGQWFHPGQYSDIIMWITFCDVFVCTYLPPLAVQLLNWVSWKMKL